MNPKRKAKKAAKKKNKKRSSKRYSTSRRGRVTLTVNPRRRRRNPRFLGGLRMPSFGGFDMGGAVTGAVGVVGSEQLTKMVAGFIPASVFQSGVGRLALKFGVSVAAIGLTKRFMGGKVAANLAAGAGIGIALDAYRLVAANLPGAPGLGEIVPSLNGIGEDSYDDSTVGGLGAIAEPAFATSW